MRWVVLVVVGALIASPARADEAPPLETALERAAKAGKPLVLEFHADWCRPCREFETKVLTRADVAAALDAVVYVRYDIDESPGDEIATKFDISGVPAFVVLTEAGKIAERHDGFATHQRFVQLLSHAVHGHTTTARLESAVRVDPSNLVARMALANHYRVLGRNADALEQLAFIAERAAERPDVAARAAAMRDEMVYAEERLATAIHMAETFVETYPESRLSSVRLVALATSGRVARDRVKVLAMAHLDAVRSMDWPHAVRAALLADAVALAQASVDDHLTKMPNDPVVALVNAELLLFTGKIADAKRVIERGCRGAGHELWCFTLRQMIDLKHRGVPATARLRGQAVDYLAAVDKPHSRVDDHTIYGLSETDPRLGNAVAMALATAQARCEHLTERKNIALVHIRLATRGNPRHVRARSRAGGELDRCIAHVLEGTWFPGVRHDFTHPLVGMITFEASRAASRPAHDARVAGILPQLAVRRGDVETYGFRGDALAEVAGRHHAAWLLGGAAELLGSDRGGPGYRLRALAGRGLGGLFGRNIHVSVFAGVGVSDLAAEAPLALELPVEVRARIDLGSVRVHISSETSSRFPATMGTSGWLGDYSFGGAASVPVGSLRLFVGVGRETRAGIGASTLFTFGTAVGDFF